MVWEETIFDGFVFNCDVILYANGRFLGGHLTKETPKGN